MQRAEIARVYGIVQGVGFRPTVARLAGRHNISGSVCNKGPYVEIKASGEESDVDAFFDDLMHDPPERAIILKLDREIEVINDEKPDLEVIFEKPDKDSIDIDCEKINRKADGENTGADNINVLKPVRNSYGSSFRIIESEKVAGEIFVSPDIATCDKCKKELFDPANRRYLHPFINCTSCGPRTTILDGMPYDRIRTSMAEFPMCPQCEYEYTHKETRRYDAQPVCCNDCGPEVYLIPCRIPFKGESRSSSGIAKYPECSASNSASDIASSISSSSASDIASSISSSSASNSAPDSTSISVSSIAPADKTFSAELPIDVKKLPACMKGSAAITETRHIIKNGGIAAIKGIGGFHLCCDATNEEAVQRLRDLKPRPAKPFAVMMRDLPAVRRECIIEAWQEEIIDGHQKPIMLLKKRERQNPGAAGLIPEPAAGSTCGAGAARQDHGSLLEPATGSTCGAGAACQDQSPAPEPAVGSTCAAGAACQDHGSAPEPESSAPLLAPGIAPDNPAVGVMLPYAPVQMLLFDYPDGIEMPDCLVMTSGNVSGAAICRDDEDAVRELSRMCDIILSHNRRIRLRADDSVMDFYKGRPYMIRRSRGYAPLPFMLNVHSDPEAGRAVLAVGGELKNTFCVARGQLFYPSPYVGDTEDMRTVKALRESMKRMCELLETKPDIIACDMHPGYNTTMVARETAKELGVPLTEVQHHYAHIASCMAENGFTDKVIGVSFDGTGYGDDGTVWGGEFLVCDLDGFERAGHIRPFMQLGGDISAKEGWRIAVSMLYGALQRRQTDRQDPGKSGSEPFSTTNHQYASADRSAAEGNASGISASGISAADSSTAGRSAARKLTAEIVQQLSLCKEQELGFQFMMADKNINAVRSTSAGRLFDAVSAVLGIRRVSTFEGEASTTLQFAAERWETKIRGSALQPDLAAESEVSSESPAMWWKKPRGGNTMQPDPAAESEVSPGSSALRWKKQIRSSAVQPEIIEEKDGRLVLATEELFMWLVEERLKCLRNPASDNSDERAEAPGEILRSADELAWIFHRALADGIVSMCSAIRERTGLETAALSGGVFQNTLLLGMCEDGLKEAGFEVLTHSMVPPNDGGICLGQAAVAMRKLHNCSE